MKKIGLLGGMSWESTVTYYQEINRIVGKRLGGLHSAELIMVSVDFATIEQMQHRGDWAGTAKILSAAAQDIERAGADAIIICTNTMHKVAAEVESAISIPLLHIADGTAAVLQADGVDKVGLLGTAFTMEQQFYTERLETAGLEVVIPDGPARAQVHDIIYQELCHGVISATSRSTYVEIIAAMAQQGAQAVILGCTEIGLLVKQSDTEVPLYDTTLIHTQSAVDFMLNA